MNYRKRKRAVECSDGEEAEEEVVVSPKPAMTNAERMKKYRLRKKNEQMTADVSAGVGSESGSGFVLEPLPGRSTDPVMFVSVAVDSISQDVTLSFHGKLTPIFIRVHRGANH